MIDQAGNETIKAEEIVLFLNRSNFDIYLDHWNEQSLYFGNYGNQLMDIDKLFGSEKFKNQISQAGEGESHFYPKFGSL